MHSSLMINSGAVGAPDAASHPNVAETLSPVGTSKEKTELRKMGKARRLQSSLSVKVGNS